MLSLGLIGSREAIVRYADPATLGGGFPSATRVEHVVMIVVVLEPST